MWYSIEVKYTDPDEEKPRFAYSRDDLDQERLIELLKVLPDVLRREFPPRGE